MHADAPLAAQAAPRGVQAEGPEGFWEMHDRLFANQPPVPAADGGAPTQPERDPRRASAAAAGLGLDMAKFKAALDASTHKAVVDADAKAGGDAGITGTPAFLINGYYISGAQPFPKFRKLIERALAEAK